MKEKPKIVVTGIKKDYEELTMFGDNKAHSVTTLTGECHIEYMLVINGLITEGTYTHYGDIQSFDDAHSLLQSKRDAHDQAHNRL